MKGKYLSWETSGVSTFFSYQKLAESELRKLILSVFFVEVSYQISGRRCLGSNSSAVTKTEDVHINQSGTLELILSQTYAGNKAYITAPSVFPLILS